MSLSARRAWIEIIDYIIDYVTDAVALRKESVDRNTSFCSAGLFDLPSLSARRAWIEIPRPSITRYFLKSLSARRAWIEIDFEGKIDADLWVALRKESVDRNIILPKQLN